jgi:basic membrane protein A and related proteins
MRKFILPLATITVTVASSTGTVSCVKAGYSPGEIGERMMLITDSGRVTDKSFNQSSYDAITLYSNRPAGVNEKTGQEYGGFDFQNRGLDAGRNYIEPLTSDAFSFISAYKIAAVKGTDILVLPGFMHGTTVDKASEIIGADKTIIFADSDLGTAPNIINLVYNSQLAGFAAGFDSAIWATTKGSNGKMQGATRGHDRISFATYGGNSSKLAVDNYMWGFMVSINYFNQRVNAAENEITDPDKKTEMENRHIYFANAGPRGEITEARGISGDNTHYFTNSFAPGDANKTGMNSLLWDQNGADLIFPIAGPQTNDTLSSTGAYVIGVDTDQSKQYTRDAGRFVTSALKNLVKSIADGIDHAKANRRNHNEDGTLMEHPLVDPTGDYWEGGSAPAQLDWSVDIDQTTSPSGTKIAHTLFDFDSSDPDKKARWAEFINEMNDYYLNKAGKDISEYMAPDRVTTMANMIYAKYNDLLPLPADWFD